MPRQRQKRVPPDYAHLFFERLNRDGHLSVLVAFMQDHADAVDERLRGMLSGKALVTPEHLAEIQRVQGALAEVERIIAAFETLGVRESPGETSLDDLFSRPARNGHRNGAAGRLQRS